MFVKIFMICALQISVHRSGLHGCSTVKTLLWMPDLMSEHSP